MGKNGKWNGGYVSWPELRGHIMESGNNEKLY